MGRLDFSLRCFHYSIGWFERRIKRLSQQLFAAESKEGEFMFRFNDALEISKAFPVKGTKLFKQLLVSEQDDAYPPEWIRQRVARVYFNLGLNAEVLEEKLSFWQECLKRMPNHYRCRELYQQLSQQETETE